MAPEGEEGGCHPGVTGDGSAKGDAVAASKELLEALAKRAIALNMLNRACLKLSGTRLSARLGATSGQAVWSELIDLLLHFLTFRSCPS